MGIEAPTASSVHSERSSEGSNACCHLFEHSDGRQQRPAPKKAATAPTVGSPSGDTFGDSHPPVAASVGGGAGEAWRRLTTRRGSAPHVSAAGPRRRASAPS